MSEFRKPCFRSLDRSFSIFGLEPGDIAVAVALGAACTLFVQPLLGVATAIAVAGTLRVLKRGKPPGYLYTLAYRTGLVALLPLKLVHSDQVRPPLPGQPRTVRLSAVPGELDRHHALVRFWHQDRERFLA